MSDENELQSSVEQPVEQEISMEQFEAENPSIGAGLASASEEKHEESSQVDDSEKVEATEESKAAEDEAKAKEATQAVINKKHFEAKQAQRERDALQAQLNEIERQKQEVEAAKYASIPEIPSEFDDDYAEKMSQRDQVIQAKANFDAQQNLRNQQSQYQQQQAALAQQQEQQKVLIEHNARARALNISESEMVMAENTMLTYGIDPNCLVHIANHKDSPLIVKHLAANPQEGFALASMNPYSVDTYLNSINAKTAELKPKQTKTPSPSAKLEGNGAPAKVKNNRPMTANAKFK